MKLFLLGFAAAALMLVVGPTAFAQEEETSPQFQIYTQPPVSARSANSVRSAVSQISRTSSAAVAAGSPGVPMWTSTVGSNSITMVGGNPFFNGARVTNVPTVIVPIVIQLADGSTYDPTADDPCSSGNTPLNLVTESPLFQPYPFTINGVNVGMGQYLDEFQRANFYGSPGNISTTGDSYHVKLVDSSGNIGANVLAPLTFTIASTAGQSFDRFTCSKIAVIDYATFSSMVTNALPSLAAQGFGPSTFIVFLLHNVVMGVPGDSLFSNCCLVGYHAPTQATTNTSTQTYVVADYDTSGVMGSTTSGINILSSEIAEWMDNPLGGNQTPTWGKIGNLSTCTNNLVVSSPTWGWTFSTSGLKMPNGWSYSVPQFTFLSWFFGQQPSTGAGGLYSDGNALTVPTHGCV
jgi:hypothetical protein